MKFKFTTLELLTTITLAELFAREDTFMFLFLWLGYGLYKIIMYE